VGDPTQTLHPTSPICVGQKWVPHFWCEGLRWEVGDSHKSVLHSGGHRSQVGDPEMLGGYINDGYSSTQHTHFEVTRRNIHVAKWLSTAHTFRNVLIQHMCFGVIRHNIYLLQWLSATHMFRNDSSQHIRFKVIQF